MYSSCFKIDWLDYFFNEKGEKKDYIEIWDIISNFTANVVIVIQYFIMIILTELILLQKYENEKKEKTLKCSTVK